MAPSAEQFVLIATVSKRALDKQRLRRLRKRVVDVPSSTIAPLKHSLRSVQPACVCALLEHCAAKLASPEAPKTKRQ